MRKSDVQVNTALFQWLNEQTDLTSHQVDLVDGFVFMLRKINKHKKIRLISERAPHPRFWRSHNRAFGYERQIMKEATEQLYRFYIDVAFAESFIKQEQNQLMITEAGLQYLTASKEAQLELLFHYIW
ncbi:hypothetical protein [Halalkalibacter urbisdiaboli]|uniref:hypothetical protein n=1 Tax=Halalkalibacter urbisdiaboli TaxID=1960589 RepID=UPI000B45257B|nr:hypothetical protein [Halalkalibacter urbisdiaboli]